MPPAIRHHRVGRGRARLWFAYAGLVVAVAALALAVWIMVPAPSARLLPLAVAAPELSPWLLGASLLAIALAAPALRRTPVSRAALTLGILGASLSAIPLASLPGTDRRMAAELRRGFGTPYLRTASEPSGAPTRTRPFVLADAFRGIDDRGAAQVRHTSGLRVAAADGTPLALELFRPPRPGRNSTLIVIHGGAWQVGAPLDDERFDRHMAAGGYTVIGIDYRMAPRHRFPAQLDDVRLALAYIASHAAEMDADTARVALLGRSAGAHLALLAAYAPGGPPGLPTARAVVGYYGPVDLAAGYADPPRPDPLDVRAILRAFIGGTPAQYAEAYRAASPATHVRAGLPPTLLIQGARDHVVIPRFARQLRDSLRAAGVPVALLEIPWAEHAFDQVFHGPGSQLALYHTERFLDAQLRREPTR
jgi:acetyl esterase/lipase